MNRRNFIIKNSRIAAAALITGKAGSFLPSAGTAAPFRQHPFTHRLPVTDGHYKRTCGYIEDIPIASYKWASDEAYEQFLDMKFGIRLHWGLYSILQLQQESWPFLQMSFAERQAYQDLHKTWNPTGFDADEWTQLFENWGAKMFTFTTKHHDGFSMFDTKTRIKKRMNWTAPGGPVMEDCNVAFSIMETPFKRDVVRELCAAAHKRGLKIDLYFSHPDWYDCDFRPYNQHPVQVPDASKIAVVGKDLQPEIKNPQEYFRKSGLVIQPNPTDAEVTRMMQRHRTQLEELITRYGDISMICLDQWLGPRVWPQLRETLMHLRKLRPDVMYRARGIGNYGDYYTPEGFVPGDKENTDTPWFVIYPLGDTFSYDPDTEHYKGAAWVVKNIVDAASKGGSFMVGIGPDLNGRFHSKAIEQLNEVGIWLRKNGEGIYATRPRPGAQWKEGEQIRFTRAKSENIVYAFSYNWPGEEFILKTVKPTRGSNIHFLGFEQPLKWSYDSSKGLTIFIPSEWKEKFNKSESLTYGFKIRC
ncbi:alpha-L-fucosidase [Niabella aurantiaca]|uniref:alpha-L-fucosidase n=1 Tax=Niabella aurantiaca TaxID=379900 RepID=UPI0012F92C0D|nr:alpha-L-fucosidase [Niabella aurantiaca]